MERIMKSRFNEIYKSCMKRFVIAEQIEEEGLDRYEFSDGADGKIVCKFDTTKDGVVYHVVAVCDKPMSFTVTEENGGTETLSEKDFILKFSYDYDKLDKALKKHKGEDVEKEPKTEEDTEDGTGIKSFSVQIRDDDEKDPNVKMTKTITIDAQNFVFSMLQDPAVDNYCECTFDEEIEDGAEVDYYKALLDIKQKNSIILKIMKYNEDGEILDTLTRTDLENEKPELAERLTAAIKKMEYVVWEK